MHTSPRQVTPVRDSLPMSNDLAKALDQRHPSYSQNAPQWDYFHDAYEGGPLYPTKVNPLPLLGSAAGGFDATVQAAGGPTTVERIRLYLWQYPLERTEKYRHRLARAITINICKPVVDFVCSIVGNPDHILHTPDPDFADLIEDADLQGQSLDKFMDSCRTTATTVGHTFIFVDSTRATGEVRTQRDAMDQGIRPYFIELQPSQVLNWRLDQRGRPVEVLFETCQEVQGSVLDNSKQEPVKQYHHWTPQTWTVFVKGKDGQGQDVATIVGQGANPLGVIPIACQYHKRKRAWHGDSLIKDAAKINQLLTNWFSSFDEAIENQMFAVPVWKSEKDPVDQGVGMTVLTHLNPTEGEDFYYVTPDPAPLESCWSAFYRLIQLGNSTMGVAPKAVTDDSVDQKSGKAKEWDFEELAKICIRIAKSEQDALIQALDFAAMWRKGTSSARYKGSVQYVTKYDLASAADDINDLIALQTAGAPPTARAELMKRILAKKLTSLPESVRKKMMTEVDKLVEMLGMEGSLPEPPAAPAAPAKKEAAA